jgi:hypothetical protein
MASGFYCGQVGGKVRLPWLGLQLAWFVLSKGPRTDISMLIELAQMQGSRGRGKDEP